MNKQIAVLLLVWSSCSCTTQRESGDQIELPSGLIYQVVEEGIGDEVQEGDKISIEEWQRYSDGTLLFSTDQIGHPAVFTVGAKQAIDGLDEGVRGMKLGERRRLIIPPALSKRKFYPNGLSPDSTLYYEVLLTDIERAEK